MAITQAQIDKILGSQKLKPYDKNQSTITNTPRDIVSGTYADILKPFVSNPVAEFIGASDLQKALDSASYGQSMTTGGSMQTGGIRPEYLAVALGLTPMGKGKKLSSLEQIILDKKGDDALQRFQKAKSLVPNLENQYTPKALERLFTQSDKYGLTVMKPSEFENFASPLSSDVESIKKYSKKTLEDADYSSYPEFIEYLKEVSKDTGFSDVPFLHLNKEETGIPLNPFISGHEGRHRTRAQSELGDVPTLVELRLRGDLYPSLPNENYIDALNKEMAYNPLIYPQPTYIGGKDVPRLPRKLPNEIFGAAAIPTTGLLTVDENKKKKTTKK